MSRRGLIAPLALCAFVAALGALPHFEFADRHGLEGFKSAYDEDTYLLGDLSVAYRLLSDTVIDALRVVAPSGGSLLVLADLTLPVAVALSVWALVSRTIENTALRLLAALLLLFGQELFSLANVIIWQDFGISDLRHLAPPATLELIPDASTSYFGLFRTPEPAVSWVLLFGFLALIAGPDPLWAFEARRRWLTIPIFAVLPLSYPYSSVPIVGLGVALLIWALFNERHRARAVAATLGVALFAFAVVALTGIGGDTDATAPTSFESRGPVLTPALVIGIGIAAALAAVYKRDILRRGDLFVPFVAALIPVALSNQQLLTGTMVSARDWERYTNYVLVGFAIVCVVGLLERRWRDLRGRIPLSAQVVAWVGLIALAFQLVGWQRDVHDAWLPTNLEAREINELLSGLDNDEVSRPIVVENAALVPLVRLLREDSDDFVLDYTRLFTDPVPPFSDNPVIDPAPKQRERLFEYYFRLGRTPGRVREQLNRELSIYGGFFSHFVFALRDVWPPLTDNRALRRDLARERLPLVVDEYSNFTSAKTDEPLPPALLVVDGPLGDRGDGRVNRLIAEADNPVTGGRLRVYLQRFQSAGGGA